MSDLLDADRGLTDREDWESSKELIEARRQHRRRPGTQRAAAWAQAWAQGPGAKGMPKA